MNRADLNLLNAMNSVKSVAQKTLRGVNTKFISSPTKQSGSSVKKIQKNALDEISDSIYDCNFFVFALPKNLSRVAIDKIMDFLTKNKERCFLVNGMYRQQPTLNVFISRPNNRSILLNLAKLLKQDSVLSAEGGIYLLQGSSQTPKVCKKIIIFNKRPNKHKIDSFLAIKDRDNQEKYFYFDFEKTLTKKKIQKDNRPHPPNSPEDLAHDVVEEGKNLRSAINRLNSAKAKSALLSHLRTLKNPKNLRSTQNRLYGK